MKLSEFIAKPTISFESIFEQDIQLYSFTIPCQSLFTPNFEIEKDKHPPILSEIIATLNQVHSPTLYWFETETAEEVMHLNEALNQFRLLQKSDDPNRRVVPAVNRKFLNKSLEPSKILYVGKRHEGHRKRDGLTNISGRMVIHFGYYPKGTTQGLQLAHWCTTYTGTLRLKVIALPNEAKEYLELLEKTLAKQLRPLCGQH
ncbi:hypothetical protein [Flavobacterium sp.]|jgi:hypothetical protein|uniref:hypothetical protein n=1 Tax=Flavobacterium sp. TaxID=239 RepID=UPI0022C70029|nr:hypothetical protein [Flavobacterium sp.]MCZ8145839.1 hypothetical protein [Flavobacterium sp.]MCZ8366425.1 hypothetical protein [Flavobacterium sp.]